MQPVCLAKALRDRAMFLLPAAVFPVLCLLLTLSPATAHSPYFGQSEEANLKTLGKVSYKVLNGDGIFFTDPERVVVADRDGYLLAVTPRSLALFISCGLFGNDGGCIVYDRKKGVIHTPNIENWKRSDIKIIATGGRPPRDAYPEYMETEYGFVTRQAMLGERALLEASAIIKYPRKFLYYILWFFITFLFISRIFWKWKVNRFKIIPIKIIPVILGFVGFIILIVMLFIAFYVDFLLEGDTDVLFLLTCSLGGGLAFLTTRPSKTAG